MSKARPSSATSQSRTAWGDYGGHARPDSQFDFGQHDIRDDPDLSPTAMEDDAVYDKGKGKGPASASSNKKQNNNKGCLGKIGGGIRSLWATRQTEDVKGDRELHVKTTLRELIIYIVFLVILCLVTFGMTQTTMYYYTKVMSDLFLDKVHSGGGSFRTITSVEDFWKFAKGPLLDGLYWETWYNNDTMPADQLGYIYYENKLLGVPRLRSLQVHSNSCVVHEDFREVIHECYESYSESLENKNSFGKKDNYTAWHYQTQDQLDGSSHWGKIATYSGAGYVQDLTQNKTVSAAIIDYLFNERWIRRGTRALFIDFTVYNANINLFCVIRLLVEFPPTGGAIPQATMRTVKLIRYVTVFDYFIMACEFILCLFILYYMVEEAIEIKKHRFSYFKSVWNILDIIVIAIAIVCVAFNVYRTIKVDELLQELVDQPDQYADFEFLSYGQTQFDNAIAIAVFFAWVKIFKYISFNKTMTQLSSTLGKCAKDLAGFAVMFFIIFLAFTQLGYLLFGTQVKDFSNFQSSFFTLFRIILGDFDFDQLEAANRILGPIFFMLFVFFVFFVLINMFLAIINDTYSEVKGDMANQKNEFEMTDYFKRGYEKMLTKLNFKHDKIVDIQKALHSADINNDKQVDFDEWRQDLKTRGYADGEIEALFAKYDVDGDRVLDEEEQRRMQCDLNDQRNALTKEYDELEKSQRPESARRSTSRVSFNDDSGDDSEDDNSHSKSSRSGPSQSVSYEEFTVLSRRVDRMEHSIGSIVSKIDAVLVKLEAMEKAKLKRRETMGKILDSITESDGTSDEVKREQMERLVREELERWDSESSITPQTSARGASPGSSARGGARSRSGGNALQADKFPNLKQNDDSSFDFDSDSLDEDLIETDKNSRLAITREGSYDDAHCVDYDAQNCHDYLLTPDSERFSNDSHCHGDECIQSNTQILELRNLQSPLSMESPCTLTNMEKESLVQKPDIRPITPIIPGIPSCSYSRSDTPQPLKLSLTEHSDVTPVSGESPLDTVIDAKVTNENDSKTDSVESEILKTIQSIQLPAARNRKGRKVTKKAQTRDSKHRVFAKECSEESAHKNQTVDIDTTVKSTADKIYSTKKTPPISISLSNEKPTIQSKSKDKIISKNETPPTSVHLSNEKQTIQSKKKDMINSKNENPPTSMSLCNENPSIQSYSKDKINSKNETPPTAITLSNEKSSVQSNSKDKINSKNEIPPMSTENTSKPDPDFEHVSDKTVHSIEALGKDITLSETQHNSPVFV